MANFNNLSLTSSGVKALLEAQSGKTLTLSKIGLGSGSTTSGIVSLKALITPKIMIPISETRINSTKGYMTVVAKMTNENMTEGFYWKETGLFFKDDSGNDVLFAYACITDDKYDYIPAFTDQRYVKNVRIANIITNTANITVEETDGLLYVDTITFNTYKEEVKENFNKSIKYDDVVDNLLSDSDDLPLSAKQGSVLKESIDQLNSDWLEKVYPIGSIYMSVNSANPSTYFGGTWEAWGSGRVPVGVNTSDTNFATVEKAGGASTVTLTAAQSGVPAHAHGLNSHTHGLNSHTHTLTSNSTTGGVMLYNNPNGQLTRTQVGTSSNSKKYAFTASETDYLIYGNANTGAASGNTGAASGNTAKSTATNATSAHTNLQPYITCYMWKRTA